jgi:uncharacterized protein with GYD domain
MPTYIVLGDWTQQGVANFEQTVDRYDAGLSQMEALGSPSRTDTGRWAITTR